MGRRPKNYQEQTMNQESQAETLSPAALEMAQKFDKQKQIANEDRLRGLQKQEPVKMWYELVGKAERQKLVCKKIMPNGCEYSEFVGMVKQKETQDFIKQIQAEGKLK